MKITPFGKTKNGLRVQCCRVHCDCCPEILQYEGGVPEATEQVKRNKWTIGATGIVRCENCAKRQSHAVSHAFDTITRRAS